MRGTPRPRAAASGPRAGGIARVAHRTGAHDEAHLTTHTTSGPLCGAWRAGVRRPRCRDGTGRGEVDGVHRSHLRIPAQMASKRSRREPDHLAARRGSSGGGPSPGRAGRPPPPRFPAQARVEEGVEAHTQGRRPIGMKALTWCTNRGKRRKLDRTAVQAHRMMTLRRGRGRGGGGGGGCAPCRGVEAWPGPSAGRRRRPCRRAAPPGSAGG